jgi:hypothetical protein
MRRDGVTAEDIEDTLRQPDRVQPSVHGRTNYFRDLPGSTLRVTAIEENGEFVRYHHCDANAQKVTPL